MDNSLPKRLQTFSYWGVRFTDSSGNEFIGTCPFCLHDDTRTGQGHFFCNQKTGAFDCKSCGRQGSWRDFLHYTHKEFCSKTSNEDLKQFVELSGLPLPVLQRWKIAKYKSNSFFFPVYNLQNEVVDLRKYSKKHHWKEHRTAGSETILLGIKQLLDDDRRKEPIYICEGSTDVFALDWLLRRIKELGIVLGVPGVNVFRGEWAHYFEKRDVIIIYDHDDAGYGKLDIENKKATGSLKVGSFLSNFVRSLQYVTWPDNYEDGYDVRDHIQKHKSQPRKAFKLIRDFTSKNHNYKNTITNPRNKTRDPNGRCKETSINLRELIERARSIYKLDRRFEIGIKIAIATFISHQIPGPNNPWLFLVGPPGSGKTLILGMFEENISCIWASTLSSKALISGYGLGTNAGTMLDPSLLGKVHNRCLVLKDFTEVLSRSEQETTEVFGILTGAFDGRIKRPYGTGIREFVCNFSMLAGVTYKILSHDLSTVGDRFLKYDVYSKDVDQEGLQESALQAELVGTEGSKEFHSFMDEFLNREYDFSGQSLIGRVPRWFRDRVKPLSLLVARLRATLSVHERGSKYQHLQYEPIPEAGTRVCIQLEKLAISLSLIEDKAQIDEDIYDIIKLVALDTVMGFKLKIVQFLIKRESALGNEIRDYLNVKVVTGYIDELEQLHILEKVEEEVDVRRKVFRYSLAKVIKDLWNRAKL